MSTESVLITDLREGVLTLTLNRPRRKNALNLEVWLALRDALTWAGDDRSIGAVVLTGAGGAFSSGADLTSGPSGAHPLDVMHQVNEIALQLHHLRVPTIAKVTGVAVGSGWNLALGCDLVVATPGTRFSQIFATRGLSLDLGGSWFLPRLVGLQQAKRLALLGDFILAEEALQLGLVTWVVPEGELDGFVDDIAVRLCAGPPIALAQTKLMLNAGVDLTLRDALANEGRAQTVNFATADAAAARAAFVNRTDPVFTGAWATS